MQTYLIIVFALFLNSLIFYIHHAKTVRKLGKDVEKKQEDELDLIIKEYLPELVKSQNFLHSDSLSPIRQDIRIMQERLHNLMVEEIDNSFIQDLKNAIASTEKRLATKITELEGYSLLTSERVTFLQNMLRRLDARVAMLEINKKKGK